MPLPFDYWLLVPIIGVVLLIAFVTTIVCICLKKCRNKKEGDSEEGSEGAESESEASVHSLDDAPHEQFENNRNGTVKSTRRARTPSSTPTPVATPPATESPPETAEEISPAPPDSPVRQTRDVYEESDGLYSTLGQADNNPADGVGQPSTPPAASSPPPPPPPPPPAGPAAPTRPADQEAGDAVYSVVDPVQKERSRTLKAKREAASRRSRTDNDEIATAGGSPRKASHAVNITLD